LETIKLERRKDQKNRNSLKKISISQHGVKLMDPFLSRDHVSTIATASLTAALGVSINL
jgi:hypothetical protein